MDQNTFPAGVPAPASPGAPQNPQGPANAAGPAYPTYPVDRPSAWQFTAPAPPREPVPAATADGVAALAILPAAWCFTQLCLTGWLGLGMTLFTAAFAAIVLCYRRGAGLAVPKASLPWLVVMALSALNFAVVDNGLIAWLNLLFLIMVAAYWVAALGGSRLEDRLGDYLAADLVSQLFIVPFQNFGCLGSVVKSTTAKTKLGRSLGLVLLSCLCSLPLLWYVCVQLAQVDGGFDRFLRQVADWISLENILSVTTFLAIPVAFYLYGLLYGSQHRRYTNTFTKEKLDRAAEKRRVLPPVAAYTLLTLLCLVYALFFVIGAADILSFARGSHTPREYADFARNGFFELCRVSVVNLLVLWGVSTFLKTSQRSSAPSRIYHSILCCQTLLLIALALCKMGLYIRFCGVTWLRVCTTWFMVLLAAVFGLVLLSQFREIPLVRWTAAAFCALFLVLCWMDVDGLVVKNAVWRYETLGETDAISYNDLFGSAAAGAPELYALYQREAAKGESPVLDTLEGLLEHAGYQRVLGDPTRGAFAHFNLQRAAARSVSRGFLPQPEQEYPN